MKNTPEHRIKLWRALSGLFLDTAIDDHDYKHIARVIAEDGYTFAEAEQILWHEVYPVLEDNLRSVAGVWEGWPDQWLVERIKILVGSERELTFTGDSAVVREISSSWRRVRAHLDQDSLAQQAAVSDARNART
ncbi:MAG: hypothetical protein ABL964_16325 [Steroidobacteraceae bacterium]